MKPRKMPRQARSAATVAAIFEATIQVLLSDGYNGLTTTRVAARAGVSVGTMYQYFPHRQALLYAVLENYLEEVVKALQDASDAFSGKPLGQMAEGLGRAYVEAKLRGMPGSRALYVVAAELETAPLVDDIVRRANHIIFRALATASDATFDDLHKVTYALRVLMVGTVRAVLEGDASPASVATLRSELPLMCKAYLVGASKPRS
ncbi:TetR/AcrR family transcriptional regulator [Luteibacter jiangsuensis]